MKVYLGRLGIALNSVFSFRERSPEGTPSLGLTLYCRALSPQAGNCRHLNPLPRGEAAERTPSEMLRRCVKTHCGKAGLSVRRRWLYSSSRDLGLSGLSAAYTETDETVMPLGKELEHGREG